jgi:hypothetical protein
MPSPIYQNMINLIVGFPIWRRSSIFMDVAIWEHHTFDSGVFRCGKIYYSNSIGITNNGFPAYFGTEYPNNIFIWYLGHLLNTRSNSL